MTQPLPTLTGPEPVTTSRRPWLSAVVWLGLLIAIALIGLAFMGRTTNPADDPGGLPANVIVAAGASPSPSGSPAPKKVRPDGQGRGFAPFAFGRGGGPGPGGPAGPGGAGRFGGPGARSGAITITKIDGSQLSLATADGWTRTIDATGATIQQGDKTITVADLKVGDQIRFAETRNADGTYKVTDIVVVAPTADGTVKSVAGSILTITQRDGSARPITLTSSTTYQLGGQPATVDALTTGAQVHIDGTIASDGTFTATSIRIQPAIAAGTVTATTATSITVKDQAGTSIVIDVNASTKYGRRGAAAASLADVKVGSFVVAQGRRNADGSIAASQVVVVPAGPGKGPGHPKGPGGPAPKGSPAPSGSPTAG